MKHKVDVFCFCYCIRYAKINEIWGKVRTTMKHKVDVFGESSNFVLFFVFSYFVLTFDLTLWWFVIAFYVFWWCDYMLVWWFVWCVFSMMFDSFSLLTLGPIVRDHFDVKNLITWDKVNIGMGHYYRRRHEFIMFATNGNTRKIKNRQFPDIWRFKRIHSSKYPTQKPVEVFQTMAKEGRMVPMAFPVARQAGRRSCRQAAGSWHHSVACDNARSAKMTMCDEWTLQEPCEVDLIFDIVHYEKAPTKRQIAATASTQPWSCHTTALIVS